MRLSVEKDDPGYSTWSEHGEIRVLLDGVEVKSCVMADEEAGMVRCVAYDEKGYAQANPDDPSSLLLQERRGTVVIEVAADIRAAIERERRA